MKPSDPYYIATKLRLMLDGLAEGVRPIRGRLENALVSHAHVILVDDFPTDDLRQRWRAWRAAVTCIDAIADEGTFAATLSVMSDERASQLVRDLCSITHRLESWIRENPRRWP